ncbi:MAG: DUF2088 domain-containing protein [Acidobacteriota bacterium]
MKLRERDLPQLHRVRRSFPRPVLPDLERSLFEQLEQHRTLVRPGSSIAIGVGSRGIARLARVVRVVASWVTTRGGGPFIVPAMGSHGGATAEGQAQILADYGVQAESVGAPIRSSMEVVELRQDGCEARVYQDRQAFESDGIIVINRVKPHTDFHGRHESGLMKMIAIGLGKRAQAAEIHRHGVRGLRDLMPEVARRVLAQSKPILGIGIVENAYEEIADIRAVPGPEIPDRDASMLNHARDLMPALPVDQLDLLIVDQIGKDISGVGLDTNVIGRLGIRGEPDPERPRIKAIIARELTPGSHGNALGIGLADVITRRLYDSIDSKPLYENLYVSGFLERGKVPIVAQSDAEALFYALRACPGIDPTRARVIRIQNTLRLDSLHVSSAVLKDLEGRNDIEVLEPVGAWCEESGELTPF